MEDFPQEFLRENCSINVKFLDNKTGDITAATYFLLLQKLKIVFSELGLVLFLSLEIMF